MDESRNIRLIARLDVKGPNLVKGVQFEGLRKLGDPNAFARKYYEAGIDEILYIDIVASLYERNNLLDIVRRTTEEVFVPITVGGGLRKVEDVAAALRAGADKVAINTAALRRPELISEVAEAFGSQCVVASIQAKQMGERWEAYCDNGREKTGIDVLEWVDQVQQLGAGEILLTSVDREGTARGFDLDMVREVSPRVRVPLIVGGGMARLDHLTEALASPAVDAVAMAHVLHYEKLTLDQIRVHAAGKGYHVRQVGLGSAS